MIHGDRLRRLRQDRGLSAEDMAKALQMSKSQVLRYENNKGDATTDVLRRFADFFSVSTDYLLDRTPIMETYGSSSEVNIDVGLGDFFDGYYIATLWQKGELVELMMLILERVKTDPTIDLEHPFSDSNDETNEPETPESPT